MDFNVVSNSFAVKNMVGSKAVSGAVNGVWGDDSNEKIINVIGDIWIEAGDTLEIAPGTEIIFQKEYSFNILEEAKLYANGKKNDSIYFKNLGERTWKGIRFNKNASSPEINYCSFVGTKNEDQTINAALHFEKIYGDYNLISNCSFLENKNGAIFINDFVKNQFVIRNVNIFDCEEVAITINGGSFNEQLVFENCTIVGRDDNIALTGIDIANCEKIGTLEFREVFISGCEDDKIDSEFQIDNEGAAINVDRGIEISEVKIQNVKLIQNEALSSTLFIHATDTIFVDLLHVENCEVVKGAFNVLCKQLEITNSNFTNSEPLNGSIGGGAIFFVGQSLNNENSGCKINNSVFLNNENKNGNGNAILIYSAGTRFNKIEIVQSTFENNKSENSNMNGRGGAIAITAKSVDNLSFNGNVFENNEARLNGGAVFLNLSEFLRNNTFKNNNFNKNIAKQNGGAVYFKLSESLTNNTISNNTFENNKAQLNGGAFYLQFSDLIGSSVVESGLFQNNSAQEMGGVFYLQANTIKNFEFKDAHINGNQSVGNGGVLHIEAEELGVLSISNNKSEVDTFSSSLSGSGGFANIQVNSIDYINIAANQQLKTYSDKNGGFISLNTIGTHLKSLRINDNKNLTSKSLNGNGGFIDITGKSVDLIEIKNNTLDLLESNNGGFLFSKFETIQNLNGSANTIEEIEVKEDGGFLNLTFKTLENNLEFIQNNLTNVSVSGNGGVCSINAADLNQNIHFEENMISSISSVGSGGVLYLSGFDGGNCELHDKMVFTKNEINEAEAKYMGGIIYSNAFIENEIDISFNTILNVKTNNSGAYYFSDNSINKSPIHKIKIEGENKTPGSSISTNGSGGWFWIKTNRDIESLEIIDNEFEKLSAKDFGGGFYIESPYISELKVNTNSISSTSADNNGGFIAIKSDSIYRVEMLKNRVETAATTNGFGGLASFANCGITNAFIFDDNSIKGEVHASNGGLLFLGKSTSVKSILLNDISITNNSISANSNVDYNGGYFYLNGNIREKFSFSDNTFSGSVNVKDGGIIFINNEYENTLLPENQKLNSITILANQLDDNSKFINCENGGFVSLNGSLQLEQFSFIENKMECEVINYGQNNSEGRGGIVDINGDNIEIEKVLFQDNKYTSVISSDSDLSKGGVLNINANLGAEFEMQNDEIGFSSAGLGGVLQLKNYSEKPINCNISNNVFTEIYASKSNGALINLESENIGSVQLTNNEIDVFEAEESAAVYISSSKINKLLSKKNHFSGNSKADGGVFYLNTLNENVAVTEIFSSIDDSFEDCYSSNGSGGVFYSNIDTINSIIISANKIENVGAKVNGGFLCLADEVVVKDFKFFDSKANKNISSEIGNGGMFYFNGDVYHSEISANTFENISAGESGGILYINGNIQNSTVSENLIKNASVAENGGALFLDCNRNFSNLAFVDNRIQNELGVNSNNGGVIYCTNLKSVEISNNDSLSQLNVNSSGGVLFASFIDSIHIQNNSFVSNRSYDLGGAIYISESGIAQFEANKFNTNVSENKGGAVYLDRTSFKMDQDTLIYNSSNVGGAVYLNLADGEISNSSFEYNFLQEKEESLMGGAIFIENENNTLNIFESNFGHHIHAMYGGVIYAVSGNFNFKRNRFFNNQARFKGSAIYLLEGASNSSFYNCLFDNNNNTNSPEPNLNKSALNDDFSGRAVINVNIGNSPDTTKIINCTLNEGNYYAVGLVKTTNENTLGRCIIKNSILYSFNNSRYVSVYDPENLGILSHCSLSRADLLLESDSCIFGDPGFEEFTDCYDLKSDSPCIDKGDTLSVYNDTFDNNCNKGGQRNDIGMTGGPFAICNQCTSVGVQSENLNPNWNADNDFGVRIYPNPTKKYLNIELGEFYNSDFSIEIFSIMGVLVYKTNSKKMNYNELQKMELNEYQPGTYFIRIRNNEKLVSKQFVIL